MTSNLNLNPTLVKGKFARVVGINMTQWWLADDANLEANAIRSFGHFTPLDRDVDSWAIKYAAGGGTYILYTSREAAERALAQA